MKTLYLIIFVFLLNSCSPSEKNKKPENIKTIKVTLNPIVNKFYYTGTIQPIKTVVVTSPVEGVIEDMQFHYGDKVYLNNSLFTIFSDKFQSEYKSTLMQYIKAKTDFNNSENQLKEADFLHKNELISDDDYKSKKLNFYTSRLNLIQSQDSLTHILQQLNIKGFNLYDLTIKDIDKINKLLNAHDGSQKLHIKAHSSGVALLPIKNDSNNFKRFSKGDLVKQGDLLAMIGDVSGLTIHIKINEFNVNQIKVGQKVNVTGTAFSKYSLQGYIASIDKQGQSGQGGAPVFPVDIIVPSLTIEQQELIHMGMSAKVEIIVQSENLLAVPIRSVFEKNGSTCIRIKKNNQFQDVIVRTGITTENLIVIESNLKSGDEVVTFG
ncbi:efflux RND transporter periplasmic adaptor subunit [Gammaproteobacteria bacterium]|nr:efflux RND transporter periplasmic adaptor subunit [Gammaproteobacteria bacterium]